ncbi:MAG: FAD-dependent oxidoreductase [Chlamydiales bacterium]|nr:FAD-dependent oxidoreductase [Chlamydiales bacterium]
MDQYTYLIVGGGMTADAAVRGIRELDMSGRIGIVSAEKYLPYDRPPLSKGLWIGKQEDEIWCKTEQENVSFHLGKRVSSIHPDSHEAIDTEGNRYHFQKLLLATGGRPRRLQCADEGVIYFRTLDDYHYLRSLYNKGEEFIVIGSGYIGTEIAASLAMNGKKVTMIFREPTIGSRKFPSHFSHFLTTYYSEKGVKLVCKQTIVSVKEEHERYTVQTSSGDTFHADGVIAGLGIDPSTELAESAGLKVDNGINVDRQLQSSHPDIFAAGDVANFYNPYLEKRLRVEHEDTAKTMGRAAGKNMAGAGVEYHQLPYFYSDLFELGYEAVGEINSGMEIIEDWHELYHKGVIYYLREGCVRGALLWGIWNQIDRIREMIASKEAFTPDALVGKVSS